MPSFTVSSTLKKKGQSSKAGVLKPLFSEDVPSPSHFTEPLVFSVSALSKVIKDLIEGTFPFVRVKAEVSGLKRHASGHTYFSLKDEDQEAVLNAICWRGTPLSINLEDGMEVIVTGRLTIYPGRSQYQMIVTEAELAGEGALLKLLEERKKKFSEEGLFNKKRPLPVFPQKIGVVTSLTGSVFQDILHRLTERYPCSVLIWPVAVQGSGAAEQIALAIRGMNDLESQRKPDVLIVARGGGSLEDLWAFNEECVVRAAFHSEIPLISAIGHETDTTLIDFVADKRAPTPTAAAEMATPVLSHIWIRLQSIKNQSVKALVNLTERMTLKLIACRVLSSANLFQERMFRLEDCSEQLAFSWQRQREKRENMLQYYKTWLKRPAHFLSEKVLQDKGFRLVTLSQALIHSWQRTLEKRTDMLEWRTVKSSWIQSSLSAAKLKLETPTQRLLPIIQQKLRDAQQNLEWCSHTLAQNSYETILKKGFCMATDESKRIIKSAQNMSAGTRLSLHFSDGTIVATTE